MGRRWGNDRSAVSTRLYVKADWPEEGRQKDDWIRLAMSHSA